MLKVDLGRLERERRLDIDESVPAQDLLWDNAELKLHGPVEVDLEAQQAGPDVVLRGTIEGEVEASCRRCLRAVRVPVREEVALLFRRGISQVEAEAEEVYALPEGERELDLTDPVREQFLLAAPQFVSCSEDCKGLCPHCGANLNETTCDCHPVEVDDRWAALRNAFGQSGGK